MPVLGAQLGCRFGNERREQRLVSGRHDQAGRGVARDGIVGAAPFDARQTQRHGRPQPGQQPGQQGIGIAPLLVDIDAGMAALQTMHPQLKERVGRGRGFMAQGQGQLDISAAGAADGKNPFVLGIEINQYAARKKTGRQGACPGQARFFINGA